MDIADLIADPDTLVTLPGITIKKVLDDLKEAKSQRDTFRLTAESLESQIKTTAETARQEKEAMQKRLNELELALEQAKKPPLPPTPPTIPNPIPRTPLISKTEASGLAALTIENGDDEPNLDQYALIRKVFDQAGVMGFNAGRWFMNAFEVAKHLTLEKTNANHLPGYASRLNIVYIADTVDSEVWRALKIESDPKKTAEEKARATAGLKAYLEGLQTLGARAFVVNDANQYREMKTKDGAPLYPEGTLERIVGRIRAITPHMPLIASLTASAKIGEYPMFDLYEAQTFGTPNDLRQFLDRAFDIFCLDARRGMSAVDIVTRGAIILEKKPKAFFYYADLASDWLNMTLDKQNAIRGIIKDWKAAR